MAGAGYKLFNTGDVLTATDVNTYLMQQTVMVFNSAAARTTALSGVVAEGMLSYLKDTNAVEVYDGANWVASDDPNAIQNTIVDAKGDLITATGADTPARLVVGANETRLVADSTEATGLKYVADTTNYAIAAKGNLLAGTAADTVAALTVGANNTVLTADSSTATGLKWANPGLTYITGASFSAVNGFNLPDNTFSATFKNYRVICTIDSFPTSSGTMPIVAQLRVGGVNNTSSNYYYTRGFYYPSTSGAGGGLSTYIEMLAATAPNGGHFILDILSPFDTVKTQTASIGMVNQNGNLPIGGMSNCQMTVTTSYDSLAVATAGANTMTGNYRVYGYGE